VDGSDAAGFDGGHNASDLELEVDPPLTSALRANPDVLTNVLQVGHGAATLSRCRLPEYDRGPVLQDR